MHILAKIQRQVPSESGSIMKTEELRIFYQIIEQCHLAKTTNEIGQLLQQSIRKLMPHSMTAYGIGELPNRKIFEHVNLGFPEDYLKLVVDKNNLLASPVAKQWAETQTPLLITENNVPKQFPLLWQQGFRKLKIRNIIVHGLVDMTGKQTSYFSFADFHVHPGERETHIIDLLVPHLHVAITRCLEPNRDSHLKKEKKEILSNRESEILKWVYNGKTNSEIGDLLCISGFTVKNHIKNILDKLGAANRTHAVAKAVNLGILNFN